MAQRLSPMQRNERGIRLDVKDRLKKKIQIIRENSEDEAEKSQKSQTRLRITSRPEN